jgi:PAS domain S-box-containing protein
MDREGTTGRFLLFALAAALAVLGAVLLLDTLALTNFPVVQQKLLLLTPGLAIAASLLAAVTAELGRRRESAAAEVRFHSFLESLPEAVFVTDPAGQVVFVNNHTERMLGRTATEVTGKPLDDFLRAPARTPDSSSGEEPVGRSRSIGERQFLARCRDGSERIVDVSCSTLRARGRSLLITILRDTTARWKSDCRRAARRGAGLALAESASLDEAAPRLLRAICESFGWDLGVLWIASMPGETFHRAGAWMRPGVDDSAFAALGCGGVETPPKPL